MITQEDFILSYYLRGMIMTDRKDELRRALGQTKQDLMNKEEDAKRRRIQAEKDAFNAKLREEVSDKDMAAWQDKKVQLEANTDALWADLEKHAVELIDAGVTGYDAYHTSLNKVFRLQQHLCLALNAAEKEKLHSMGPKAKQYAQIPGAFGEALTRGPRSSAMDAYRKAADYMKGVSSTIEDDRMPFSDAERDAMREVNYAELLEVNGAGELTFNFLEDDAYLAYLNDPEHQAEGDTRSNEERAESANKAFHATTEVLMAQQGYFLNPETNGYEDADNNILAEGELLQVFAGDRDDEDLNAFNEFNNFFREDVHASLEEAADEDNRSVHSF
jgi:hypothetical protein